MTQPTPTLTVEQLSAIVARQQDQIDWLLTQTANVYGRLQIPYIAKTFPEPQDEQRTETGMGAIINPAKSSFV